MCGPLAVRKDEQTRQEPQHCKTIRTINVSHFGWSVCGERTQKPRNDLERRILGMEC